MNVLLFWIQTLSPLNSQTHCAWGGTNLATRPLTFIDGYKKCDTLYVDYKKKKKLVAREWPQNINLLR